MCRQTSGTQRENPAARRNSRQRRNQLRGIEHSSRLNKPIPRSGTARPPPVLLTCGRISTCASSQKTSSPRKRRTSAGRTPQNNIKCSEKRIERKRPCRHTESNRPTSSGRSGTIGRSRTTGTSMRDTGFASHHSRRIPYANTLCKIARPFTKLLRHDPKAASKIRRHCADDTPRSGNPAAPSTRKIRRTKCRKSRRDVGRKSARASTLAHAASARETVRSAARTASTPERSTRRNSTSNSERERPCANSPNSSSASRTNLPESQTPNPVPLSSSAAKAFSLLSNDVFIANAVQAFFPEI